MDLYAALFSSQLFPVSLETIKLQNIIIFALKGSLLMINVVFYGVLFSKIFLYMFSWHITQIINEVKIKFYGTATEALKQLITETLRMEVQIWKDKDNQEQNEENYQQNEDTQQQDEQQEPEDNAQNQREENEFEELHENISDDSVQITPKHVIDENYKNE